MRDPEVPSLAGRPRAQAEMALKALGYAPVTETVAARTPRDVGVVMGQAPAGGTPHARGATVILTVGRAASAEDRSCRTWSA